MRRVLAWRRGCGGAGFAEAMQAALAQQPALGADETPVHVVAPGPEPQADEWDGAPHVLMVRPPGRKLIWLQIASQRWTDEASSDY